MVWPNRFEVEGYAEHIEALHTLLTGGEVIRGDFRAELSSPRRVVVRAVEQRIEVRSGGMVTLSHGPVGLVSDNGVWLEPTAIQMLWDLLSEGYCEVGPIGIRSKGPNPTLLIDEDGDHVRLRSVDTVLELDYPGMIDPDINEVRIHSDRMVIDKSGVDIHVSFK